MQLQGAIRISDSMVVQFQPLDQVPFTYHDLEGEFVLKNLTSFGIENSRPNSQLRVRPHGFVLPKLDSKFSFAFIWMFVLDSCECCEMNLLLQRFAWRCVS